MDINQRINNIYIACTLRTSSNSDGIYFVPIIILNEDLKGYSILSSSDLTGLQLKNNKTLSEIATAGASLIYISVDVEMFKKITNAITDNLNVSVNTYLNAVKQYQKIVGIMGKNPYKKDISYHLYASIIGQNPCCIITPKMEIKPTEELDILRSINEAARLSNIDSDDIFSQLTASYPFNLDILDDGDDNI